jgi:hypothetical protein
MRDDCDVTQAGWPGGQHSPDRRWWWDGTAWLPAYSPDGKHWWTGTGWESRRESTRLIALTWVAAGFTIAGMASFVTWMVLGNGQTLPPGGDASAAAQMLPAVACAVVGVSVGAIRLARRRNGPSVVVTVVAAATGLVYLLVTFALFIGMSSP